MVNIRYIIGSYYNRKGAADMLLSVFDYRLMVMIINTDILWSNDTLLHVLSCLFDVEYDRSLVNLFDIY